MSQVQFLVFFEGHIPEGSFPLGSSELIFHGCVFQDVKKLKMSICPHSRGPFQKGRDQTGKMGLEKVNLYLKK